jgi:hypothetical protein
MRILSQLSILGIAVLIGWQAQALSVGDLFIDPSVGVGFNSAQGTVIRLGLDVGARIDENYYAGVGGYYATGDYPAHDREIGGGPFLGYRLPVTSFLTLHLREDLDYVDVRVPRGPTPYTQHETFYGLESATTAGVHISVTPNLGVSAGYRLAIGISNSDIAKDRSGVIFGLSIGI